MQMEVAVCEMWNVEPTVVVDFSHIEEDYLTLSKKEDAQDFWTSFISIARYEDLTFQLLMDLDSDWSPSDDWRDRIIHEWVKRDDPLIIHDTRDILTRLRSNFLITTLLNKLGYDIFSMDTGDIIEVLYPVVKVVGDRYRDLGDVYGHDLLNLSLMRESTASNVDLSSDYFTPIVLFDKNSYAGHIYQMTPGHYDVNLIGIRESLMNLFHKIYNIPGVVKGIAYYLLDAARQYVIDYEPEIDTFGPNDPIGTMPDIAMRYGFIRDNYRMHRDDIPLIEVPSYDLIVLD